MTRRQQTLSVKDRFNRAADRVTSALGSIQAVVTSVLVVVLWALCGPLFGFSDSWQLVNQYGDDGPTSATTCAGAVRTSRIISTRRPDENHGAWP